MKEFAPNLRVVTAAAVFLDAMFILISALCLEQVDGKILLGLLLGTIYAVSNHLALAYTVKRLTDKSTARARIFYIFSAKFSDICKKHYALRTIFMSFP